MPNDTERDQQKSAPPSWKWKSFPLGVYCEEIGRGVHFSIKGINSNAKPACGVRIGEDSGRRLPYVSLIRAIADGHRFPLDYTANRGSVATVFKQTANIAGWENTSPHPEAPSEEKEAILKMVEEALTTDYVEEDTSNPVSPRARQVLFPDDKGGYVSLIPLPAPVFAGHLLDRWFSYRDSLSELGEGKQGALRISRTYMGFGGANPQNAGRFIHRMRTPFIFSGPTEDLAIRRIYAIHFQGVSLRLPHDRMQSYRTWRQKIALDGRIPTDLRLRQREAETVGEIVRALLARGKRAHALLQQYRHLLPLSPSSDSLVVADADDIARGLADPVCRDRHWPKRFAETVARNIGNYRFRDGGTLGLASPAVRQLAHWIEEEVRAHDKL